MAEDRVQELLKRANEIEDLSRQFSGSARRDLMKLAESYRKMAAQEIRIRDIEAK
jgi:hypothetical protein